MFSLLVYQRYVEFWRDMWSVLLNPISEIPPGPSSLDQSPSPQSEGLHPEHQMDTHDKP